MGRTRYLPNRLSIACTLICLCLPAGWAAADTVWLQSGTKGNAIKFDNVKVSNVQGDSLTFTAASGNQTIRKLSQVPQIKLDDEPVFSTAEAAFADGDWATAADSYRKAAQTSLKDWIIQRSSLRLLEAAAKSGNFPAAVAGFVDLLQKDPALANDHKPVVPTGKAEQLDPAIAQVKEAAQNAKAPEQKTVLLNYLVEMYNAKGDAASASAVLQQLGKVAPAEAAAPGNRKIQADVKLTEARQALAQKQYARVIEILDAGANLFADAPQQAEALYLMAEAKAASAKPTDVAELKDAALAYMRVVALFRNVEGKPHVAESLLKTAAIEEKLKNAKEAMAIYQQVAAEFKGSPEAIQAEQNAARLAPAASASKE